MELNTNKQQEIDKRLDSDQQNLKTLNKSKRLKHQQKLARLVATTFGPDSIDLFKNTMSAAAAVESSVAAHATNTLAVSGQTFDRKSSAIKSKALVSQDKTTKKINKKFNLLQKKITSLIESNQLESFNISSGDISSDFNNEDSNNAVSNDMVKAKKQSENNYKNFQVEEDEVSEVNLKFC